ncbi:hypothetical protein Tco_0237677 [Tanacetum coccineum]
MTVVMDRVQTLVEQGEHVANILDVAETEALELRDIMDNYPHRQVDALRVEVDRLHGSAATTSQEVQTLETALQEARAEILDLGTRLSMSETTTLQSFEKDPGGYVSMSQGLTVHVGVSGGTLWPSTRIRNLPTQTGFASVQKHSSPIPRIINP